MSNLTFVVFTRTLDFFSELSGEKIFHVVYLNVFHQRIIGISIAYRQMSPALKIATGMV